MNQKEIIPFEATHPGILIKDELDVHATLTQKELAKELGVQPSFLNEIIKGKRPVTADIAILLEKILGIPADYWMRFQSQYEIDLARIKEKNIKRINNIEVWNIIKEYVPVKYFSKFGYLKGNLEIDIETIKSIYSFSSIEQLVNIFARNKYALYRKSDKLSVDQNNMIAWSTLAQFEAKKQVINTFNFDNIPQLIILLNEIFYQNSDVLIKSKELLNQFGIKLVFLEKLEKTPIDGFAFWSINNPAIAMTLRYHRIDNFAFTLMHEIGHIFLHLKNDKNAEFIDLNKQGIIDSFEKEANLFAQNNLINITCWNELLQNVPLDDSKVINIGNQYRINSAIILGRICHEMNHYALSTIINKEMH
ncbi:MAG TPA: HigA family addiction module antitoxin [Flavobacterium sp.]|nr:HigA family addiction module antitoxin [Flavobacterium sp.]